MKRLAWVLVLAAGCTGGERNQTGDCPPDEVCSPLTPDGMHFTGVSLLGVPLLAEPKTTAAGGTQTIGMRQAQLTREILPLDLAFAASPHDGPALTFHHDHTEAA